MTHFTDAERAKFVESYERQFKKQIEKAAKAYQNDQRPQSEKFQQVISQLGRLL